jgi:hypothetical protein
MNDISSGAPAASAPAPASPQPSSTPSPSTPSEPSSPETLAHLAQGERVDEYAEQRAEDEGKINRDLSPSERSFNRHQRARAKLERLRAENAALKAQGAAPAATDGAPDDAAQFAPDAAEQPTAGDEQPQQMTPEQFEQHIFEQANETIQRERRAEGFKVRQQMAAAHFPDFHQVLAQAPQVPLPQHVADQIMASPWGPILQYGLARPEGQADFVRLLQASPREQQRMLDRWEVEIEAGARQRKDNARQQRYQQSQPRRVTQASRPIVPLKGSAGPSPDLKALANSDNIDSYARHRMAQMRNGKR